MDRSIQSKRLMGEDLSSNFTNANNLANKRRCRHCNFGRSDEGKLLLVPNLPTMGPDPHSSGAGRKLPDSVLIPDLVERMVMKKRWNPLSLSLSLPVSCPRPRRRSDSMPAMSDSVGKKQLQVDLDPGNNQI